MLVGQDIGKMDVMELKATAYDLMIQKNFIEKDLVVINGRIAQLLAPPEKPVKKPKLENKP